MMNHAISYYSTSNAQKSKGDVAKLFTEKLDAPENLCQQHHTIAQGKKKIRKPSWYYRRRRFWC